MDEIECFLWEGLNVYPDGQVFECHCSWGFFSLQMTTKMIHWTGQDEDLYIFQLPSSQGQSLLTSTTNVHLRIEKEWIRCIDKGTLRRNRYHHATSFPIFHYEDHISY